MKRFYLSAAFLIASLNSHATVYYVDSTATGANNGTSWSNAYHTLAQAMNAVQAAPGPDSILIARGTYYPAGTATGNSIYKDSAFTIQRGGIQLYGGYPNGGGVRDPAANPVYLDGTANSYHIMVIAGIPANADSVVIDGFTLRNGMAETATTKTYNGQTISNDQGGGMYLANGGKTAIRNCIFTSNKAYLGAGMTSDSSSPVFTNCSFTGNTADPVIYGGAGGAMHLNAMSLPTFIHCSFSGNKAVIGGAIYNFYGYPVITGCSFANNMADDGGAIYNFSVATITNSVFTGNSAGSGSAIYNIAPSVTTNCTFYGNIAGNSGGVLYNDLSNPTYTNCIIYGNTGSGGPVIPAYPANPQNITYSIVEGGYPGTGNSNSDPLFINTASPAGADGIFGTADDGLQLNNGSPAINAGNNTAITGITTDLRNMTRIVDTVVDMGAYEKQRDSIPPASVVILPASVYITIAPNPARSAVTISGLTAGMSVRIVTTDGRILNEKTVTAATETADISNLPNGMYLVETLQNGVIVSKRKLVKD